MSRQCGLKTISSSVLDTVVVDDERSNEALCISCTSSIVAPDKIKNQQSAALSITFRGGIYIKQTQIKNLLDSLVKKRKC